jgi:post-segregation antitoxin (ccd killing protein)
MLTNEAPKTRRLNIMVSETLIECLAANAEDRGVSMSAFVREAIERECERTQEQVLAEAAESLASLYESDSELTAFLALDGDEFA